MDRIPDDDQNFFFMLDAFAEALGARLKRAQAEDKKLLSKGPPDSDNLDSATEESEVWEIRTNRWAKESLSVMNEKKKGFRVMKLIVRKASGPWQHFYVLLSQKTNNGKPNALGRLVWGGTSRIIDDFEALLDTSTWAPVLMEHAEDASQAKDMLTAALATVLRNYAGFDRRVVRRLFQLDFQILLLGKHAPNKCCEERKVVARRLLREENLSSTPHKIKTLFKKELQEAAVTGELDNRVQAVFVALARAWDGDSQSTEGLNSRVRQRTQKAPNLGLYTLNADIGTSSMMQLGTKDAPQGWSVLKLKLQSLCHMAEQGFEDKALMARVRSGALGVASDSEAEVGPGGRQSRWEIPPPSYQFPKAVKLENRPQQFVDKWAAECSVRWFRAFQPKEGLNCILAAFTVGPDLFSLSAVLAMEELSAEHQQEFLRFVPECDGVPLPLDFILHRALCRVHFWPPALPRGAHVSGSHSAEACALLIFNRRIQRMVRGRLGRSTWCAPP